jgi:hypothetical protein
MFKSLIIANLFVTLGYAFFAMALLIFFLFSRKNSYIAVLAGLSNGVLAFYSLCIVLISLAIATEAWWGLVKNRMPYLVYFRSSWEFALVLACMAFPYLRRRPLWLLVPFALLINIGKVLPHTDTGAVFTGLLHEQQAVLWGLCALYCLVILLLFLISGGIKRFMAEEQS